jgi:hypothetical protein
MIESQKEKCMIEVMGYRCCDEQSSTELTIPGKHGNLSKYALCNEHYQAMTNFLTKSGYKLRVTGSYAP